VDIVKLKLRFLDQPVIGKLTNETKRLYLLSHVVIVRADCITTACTGMLAEYSTETQKSDEHYRIEKRELIEELNKITCLGCFSNISVHGKR